MSGDTVTGLALQFTNDNKHAYAYSGKIVTINGSEVTLMHFDTNSEYHVAQLQFWYDASGSGSNIEFKISFNNIKIACYHVTDSIDAEWSSPIELIIPPFTNVLIEAKNAAGTEPVLSTLTTKVGMPQRVGNLDD